MPSSDDAAPEPLKRTPLFDLHVAAGARMVPFAGYEMPVQYPTGILKEHLWTREKAGLFDVSHMGQASLAADDGRFETAARALEALCPADFLNLKPGQQRYSQLLSEDGGVLDDLMVTRPADPNSESAVFLVVNAACKTADYRHIEKNLPKGVRLTTLPEQALLALQGPAAARIMQRLAPKAAALNFMTGDIVDLGGIPSHISRSGYTGEDGFEISVASACAADVWRLLAQEPDVLPIGLGARDSLRLEAGLCLYGHELDVTTSPVEANLVWSIQKRRRDEGGFPGADRIQRELKNGPKRLRVGLKPEGRAPAREGTEIQSMFGDRIGVVTSGGFGPSVNGPVAMGYVEASVARPGANVQLVVRGRPLPASIVALPFVPHRYVRKS